MISQQSCWNLLVECVGHQCLLGSDFLISLAGWDRCKLMVMVTTLARYNRPHRVTCAHHATIELCSVGGRKERMFCAGLHGWETMSADIQGST